MGLEAGQIIEGKYRILRLLGEGGMGAVYEGENVRIHRKVAIKVLHAGVAENKDVVQRFEREAQAAGRIGSDHIVEVLDLGNLPEGDRFMVMEYLDGEALASRIQKSGRMSPQQICPIMIQLLEGLGAAHDAGIIHRDLKPDNVFLLKAKAGHTDFVKIVDFGISKFSAMSGEGMSMTRTGAVMGTPYYMSPEQAKGARDMDHRSDLYSVGVIVYECVTGQVPFNAETFNELIFKIVLEVPPPPEQFAPDLDPEFASIIRKAMAREASQRFQTAKEFAEAFQAWLSSGKGVVAPPPDAPGAAAAAVTGTGPQPAQPGLGKTGGTPAPWSNTGSGGAAADAAPVPKKSNAGLVAGLAIGAVVLLGIGGVAAMKMKGSAAAAAQPPPAATEVAPPPSAAPPPATAVAVTAAPAATPSPSAAVPPVDNKAGDGKVAAAAKAGAKTAPAATGAPPVPAKTAAAPTAAPATAAPASTGRKIRTEL